MSTVLIQVVLAARRPPVLPPHASDRFGQYYLPRRALRDAIPIPIPGKLGGCWSNLVEMYPEEVAADALARNSSVGWF